MNLGIVLSVSTYRNAENLPGCKFDGQVMETILRHSGKFDDVLLLTDQTDSAFVKEKLVEFTSKYKASSVDDIVFYYSGHGYFDGSEFYYPLSDFEKGKIRQTSLENTELDQFLRSVSPKLTIKIVDACNSGILYIKDGETFEKVIKESGGKFSKCYFMFSSQQDQYSYADDKLSFFTSTIVEAVLKHKGNSIRYKDLIDFTSDAFADRNDQTPLFIVQADFTENFCELRTELKKQLTNITATPLPGSEVLNQKKPNSIENIIALQAKDYCSEEEAHQALEILLNQLDSYERISEQLTNLYKFNVEIGSDAQEIPRPDIIGDWLVQNKVQPPVFAEAVFDYKTVQRRVRKNDSWLSSISSSRGGFDFFDNTDDDEKFKTVTRTEKKTKGFQSTVQLPMSYIKLSATPLFANLPPADCIVVILLSPTKMYVFLTVVFYEASGWATRKRLAPREWASNDIPLKDREKIESFSKSIFEEFQNALLKQVTEKFLPPTLPVETIQTDLPTPQQAITSSTSAPSSETDP